MIGLGIVTCERPRHFAYAAHAVARHLSGVVDLIVVYNDGSDARYDAGYEVGYGRIPSATVLRSRRNNGVAYAKNRALEVMLAAGCDWLFVLEDDIEPLSPLAVTGYVAACEQSGWQHLSFAHHGDGNLRAREIDEAVALYPNYVGAYAVYGREALEQCGLMDEAFFNAQEHCEHTLRLAAAGYTDPRPFYAADATGSENWLREQPRAVEESVIRSRTDWQANILAAREHWRETYPETYRLLWREEGQVAPRRLGVRTAQ